MTEAPARRRYDSARRELSAEATRDAIAIAARTLFLARGWSGTTVRDVAREAGVSVPTVYSAYGGKAGLAAALADSVDVSLGMQGMPLADHAASPQDQLAAMVGYDRNLFESSGDLIRLAREAGKVEPALADAYRERRNRVNAMRIAHIQAWPEGALRAGMSAAEGADVYGAICNVDVYFELVDERGWTPERVERWWMGVIQRELLTD